MKKAKNFNPLVIKNTHPNELSLNFELISKKEKKIMVIMKLNI